MAALTTLGIVHTAISLVAVATGAISLIRNGKISWNNQIGKAYVITTVLTCLTGFGIFQHGGFGKPHILGIITLIVTGIAFAGGRRRLGRFSTYIETVSYSMTFFFHMIPGITETTTRLPVSAPLASGPEDPHVQMAVGICFILFLIGATWQVIRLRGIKPMIKPTALP
jgi:uncharacterized membrane protein